MSTTKLPEAWLILCERPGEEPWWLTQGPFCDRETAEYYAQDCRDVARHGLSRTAFRVVRLVPVKTRIPKRATRNRK